MFSIFSNRKPTPSSASPKPITPPCTPLLFNVFRNEAQVLDFSPSSQTPESTILTTLSSHPSTRPRAMALIGMGGTGKSTIFTALANHPHVHSAFPTAICFLQLGQNAHLSSLRHTLLSFIASVCPSVTSDRLHALWSNAENPTVFTEHVRALSGLSVLLVLDDVWCESPIYQAVVMAVAEVITQPPGLTLLMASRDAAVAAQIDVMHVRIEPRPPLGQVSSDILCRYAKLSPESLNRFPPQVKNAFDGVLHICAGLPIALAVAGGAVYRATIMPHNASVNVDEQHHVVWVDFYSSLKEDSRLLGERGTSFHQQGLFGCIKSSLNALIHIWPSWMTIAPHVVFQAFSTVETKAWTPFHVLRRLSGMSDPQSKQILSLFIERNIISSLYIEEELCFRLHDLVLDYCRILAAESNVQWHGKLLKAYEAELRPDKEVALHACLRPWWQKPLYGELYIRNNVVRHLLCYGAFNEALHLAADYRWLQVLNSIETQAPFEQAMSDLALLKQYLMASPAPMNGPHQDTIDSALRGIEILLAAMGMCVVPSSTNRAHAPFQLYGRLCGIRGSTLVAYCLWSIDKFAESMHLRPSPGVLRAAKSVVKRAVATIGRVYWMKLTATGNELLVGVLNKGLQLVDVLSGANKSVEGECVCRFPAELTTDGSSQFESSSQSGRDHSWIFIFHAEGVHFLAKCRDDVVFDSEEHPVSMLHTPGHESMFGSDMIHVPLIQQHDLFIYRPGYNYSGLYVGEIWLIERSTGVLAAKIVDQIGPIHVTNDGEQIMCGLGNKIRTWSISEHCWVLPDLCGHEGNVLHLAVIPVGARIASASEDGSFRLWELRGTQGCPTSSALEGHSGPVSCILFSKDGNLLFSGARAEILVWDVSELSDVVAPRHRYFIDSLLFVKCLCLSGDGSEIFASGELFDKVFVLHADAKSLGLHGASEESVQSKEIYDLCKTFAISPDGETGVSYVRESDQLVLWRPCRLLRNELQIVYTTEVPEFETPPSRRDIDKVQGSLSDEESSSEKRSSSDESQDGWEIWKLAISDNRRLVAFILREKRPLMGLEGFVDNVDDGARPWWPFRSERGIVSNLRKLQGLQEWYSYVKSAIPKSGRDNCKTFDAGLEDVRFRSNGEEVVIEAHLRGRDEHNKCTPRSEARSMSWKASTGKPVSSNTVYGEYRILFQLLVTSPWAIEPVLQISNGIRIVEVLPLDDMVYQEYLQTDSGRLWLWKGGGLSYVELTEKLMGLKVTDKAPPQLPLLPSRSPMKGEFEVFISHAGPDKETIAVPLYESLKTHGTTVFLDREELKGGDKGAEKMERAMNTADIGVVITSPEYVARKWTMRELMCFLRRRREADAAGEMRPYIIPVFYPLSSDNCKGKKLLKHVNLWKKEGFLERAQTVKENLLREVSEAMQELTTHTGIVNRRGATNSARDHENRKKFVEDIVLAVMEKREELRSL